MTVDIIESVDVEIPYVKRNSDGELPNHAQMFSWEPEFMDMMPSTVRNVRVADQKFSIPTSGFEYARLEELPVIDYMEPEQVKAEYFPKLEEMIRKKYLVPLFLSLFLTYSCIH